MNAITTAASPIRPMVVPSIPQELHGPVLQLESLLLKNATRIESWFRNTWRKTPPPFYASVDLRNAGFKLAPVDTNLFPAGFNNLNRAFMPLCINAVQTAVERYCPSARAILFVPESHTRNTYYYESVATLIEILQKAGFVVRIGSLLPDLDGPRPLVLPSGRTLLLEPLQRQGKRVGLPEFSPCLVLLNNDLSGGIPEILQNIEQAVAPPPELGWSNRLKSGHFALYREVATEFSSLLGMDPWLIDPLFAQCGEVNFMTGEGLECLTQKVDTLLSHIRAKYEEYQIHRDPFVIVKADAGTYGMGIMTVTQASDLLKLNRKQRTHMSSAKEGREITQVIVQEGVYTFETWGEDAKVAEPVVYMTDRFVVGGFYRVHTTRGATENLNAPGMQFEPLAFAECCNNPDQQRDPDAEPNRFYSYGVIARLALVAAAREMAATAPKGNPS
jgi:glutamate--cysteine ligase